jgi:hypothetical protein
LSDAIVSAREEAGIVPDPPQKESEIARRIRARGLAYGHAPPRIAAEIYEQCAPLFGTSKVKAFRLAYGIALSDVVAQMRALCEFDGKPTPKIGETLLSAYESSYKKPGPEYLHYLCGVYRVEPDDLGFQSPCVCGHDHAVPPAAEQANAAATESLDADPPAMEGSVVIPIPDNRMWAVTEPARMPHDPGGRYRAEDLGVADEGEEEVVLRRTLLQVLAGAGVALDGHFLGAVDKVRRRMDDTLVNASVSPTMLDQWEETTIGYGQQYMSTPPMRLLCDVLLDFSEVRRMTEQRQPLELQERLCKIAARLSGLSGIIMIDLGDHRLARSFFRTARTAADETGDRALRSWVAVREAMVPLYYGDPRESMAPIIEARALSQLVLRGRTDATGSAKRALARGRAVFGQLTKSQQADTAYGYTERQLFFHEGNTYTNLGDHRNGEETLHQAMTLYPSAEHLDRTLIQFDRAICRLNQGEPDEAIATARAAVLALPVEQCTEIVKHRARQLLTTATAQYGDLRSARDFRDVLAAPSTGSILEA